MAIISETVLESNKKIRVNFDGGNLSSDGGLLLLKEFYHKLGVNSLLRNRFRTTDTASFRIHKDHENLLQMLCLVRERSKDHQNTFQDKSYRWFWYWR